MPEAAGDVVSAGQRAARAVPAGRPRRSWRELVLVAWELGAGYLLAAAPISPGIWNEDFHAWIPLLHEVLMTTPVRAVVASIGLALIVLGAWDGAGLLVRPRGSDPPAP